MPVAIQGAVIITQSGQSIKYQQRCDKCGNVSKLSTFNNTVSKGATFESRFKCGKCGNSQKIQIRG